MACSGSCACCFVQLTRQGMACLHKGTLGRIPTYTTTYTHATSTQQTLVWGMAVTTPCTPGQGAVDAAAALLSSYSSIIHTLVARVRADHVPACLSCIWPMQETALQNAIHSIEAPLALVRESLGQHSIPAAVQHEPLGAFEPPSAVPSAAAAAAADADRISWGSSTHSQVRFQDFLG
jgi:hypothetical protein